jgi:hypothetical protein
MEIDPEYTLCALCVHFVEPNDAGADLDLAAWIHLDDGEKEHDHDATPSTLVATLDEWKRVRPDLFVKYADGKIGPNSTRR